jgi:hypothetical protein
VRRRRVFTEAHTHNLRHRWSINAAQSQHRELTIGIRRAFTIAHNQYHSIIASFTTTNLPSNFSSSTAGPVLQLILNLQHTFPNPDLFESINTSNNAVHHRRPPFSRFSGIRGPEPSERRPPCRKRRLLYCGHQLEAGRVQRQWPDWSLRPFRSEQL